MHRIITSSLITLDALFLLSLLPVSAQSNQSGEVAEIKNPSWQEVPDTRIYNENQEIEPIYINVNGITRNGNVLTYDLVNPNFGYERSQTNCKTGQSRGIRQGDFESSTRVSYQSIVGSWQKPTSSYDRALLKFVCNL
jgi:hypothetical protein